MTFSPSDLANRFIAAGVAELVQRVDATYQLERAREPVPIDPGRPSGC